MELAFKPNAISAIPIPDNNDVTLPDASCGDQRYQSVIDFSPIDSGLVAGEIRIECGLNLKPGSREFHCPVEGQADAGIAGAITAAIRWQIVRDPGRQHPWSHATRGVVVFYSDRLA